LLLSKSILRKNKRRWICFLFKTKKYSIGVVVWKKQRIYVFL
jgi:predicted RNA-binding protein associated with RNAse of E/G family